MKAKLFAVFGVLILLLAHPAYSKFANQNLEEVPVERLLKNLQDYLDKHPKEAQAHYTFGRICSMAYARNVKTISASLKNRNNSANDYPQLGRDDEFPREGMHTNPKEKPTPAKIQYLRLAIEHYRAATILEPENFYAWLGYGWMVEQGVQYADRIPAPFDNKKAKVAKPVWRSEALNAFRKVYEGSSKEGRGLMNFPDPAVEAGESILRVQKMRTSLLTSKEKKEVTSIEKSLPELRQRPGAITPIIFPLTANASFQRLTATPKRVSFDMMGDGIRRQWSWVTPDAGFLVWNPKRNGRVTSGYQLFGTVTWCIMWKNGYEPLARLDNDKNGWLEGRELEGIGVWQDKNGNGICDAGEVLTLTQLGIARIAVRGHKKIGGVLSNPQGIVKRDGSTLPTFDWIAKTP
ncbi:hypothetical protein LBMAG21_01590 [Armatimonadota bacterium]|nr:hypothetical protein LBMAG21_01590 [Armatimonadota bacterium]